MNNSLEEVKSLTNVRDILGKHRHMDYVYFPFQRLRLRELLFQNRDYFQYIAQTDY